MNVHNIMEEMVFQRVDHLYDQIANGKTSWSICTCDHCRLDTASYVLNRIPPKYIVSGRGITHSVVEDDTQLKADIDALIMEGIRAVSSARRPYHDKSIPKPDIKEGPVFNFPTFIGTVYDGSSFIQLNDATITLKKDGKPCSMIDYTWQNPCTTNQKTKGAFSFWVTPEKADATGKQEQFQFTLEIECAGYDKLEYAFTVPVVSEEAARLAPNSTYAFTLQDLFIFPTGTGIDMDRRIVSDD
ncbi:MAG: late competence development ComFB family protein [Treponema sp.]|nr:late competence development ComFB family protein [Candidatus Treponema caballi]